MRRQTVLNVIVSTALMISNVGYVSAATPPTTDSIIKKYKLPEIFPKDVLQEADAIPEKIRPGELEGRKDLRDENIVTIDGEDTRDFDDAVSVKKLNKNVQLGVHIADVGYYVKEGSALDQEAYKRGTSVYLADRVLPMLPKRLSNGICSLNPGVDRLTLTCEMEVDPNGKIVRHEIYPSVIRSKERMTYTNVKKILVDHDEALIKQYEPLVADFQLMAQLAERLHNKRMQRGSLDFNREDSKIGVDKEGKPIEIKSRPRTVAERLIEEFMLAANETVAEHYNKLNVPFVYRVHDTPNPLKWSMFCNLMEQFDYSLEQDATKVTTYMLQDILAKIKGKPEESLLNNMMLRSMAKAVYTTEERGHFSLATEYYSHFTSPIRRYPDLLIHRVMREMVEEGSLSGERIKQLQDFLTPASEQSSQCERRAEKVEREVTNLKKAEFMKNHIGAEYDGVISEVVKSGFFVRLPNTVEGFINVKDLKDDAYYYDAESFSQIGQESGKVFRLGDAIRIKVKNANVWKGKVYFSLSNQAQEQLRKVS